MRSSRSSNGVRFQRLQRGQTTHNRPFHSSNAMRRPTPSPDGPPSPSNDALQKAQRTNILGSKSLGGERGNLYLGCSRGDQIYDDLAGEGRQQHAVAPMPGGVPQPPHLGIGADDGASVWRDRKSTRLNSSHVEISYAVFCLKKKKKKLFSHWLAQQIKHQNI